MICRKYLRRLAALIIAATMTISLCACGDTIIDKNKSTADTGVVTELPEDAATVMPESAVKELPEYIDAAAYLETEWPDNAYSAMYPNIDWPDNGRILDTCNCGDKVSFVSFYAKQEMDKNGVPITQNGYPQYENGIHLFEFDSVSCKLETIASFPTVSEYNDETQTDYHFEIETAAAARDGTFWLYSIETIRDYPDRSGGESTETTRSFIHIDARGNELGRLDVSSHNEFYHIGKLFIGPDGKFVIFSDSTIIVLDNQARYLFTIQNRGRVGNFAMTGDGDIVGDYSDYDGGIVETLKYARINFETKSFEDIALPGINVRNYIKGPGSTVYMYNNSGIYAYDLFAQTLTETLNWINSGVNAFKIKTVVALNDGRFLVLENLSDLKSVRLAVLANDGNTGSTGKYPITLAAADPSIQILDAIIEFNIQSAECRIELKDYSEYNALEDMGGGAARLDADLASGAIPDMLLLDGLPYGKYTSDGLLADLGALMAEDTAFSCGDYLSNILDATKVNGTAYSIIPFFNINTIYAKTDFVGSEPGWTLDDVFALMDLHPDANAFPNQSREDVMAYFAIMAMDQFYDPTAGKCSFDSPEFAQYLTFFRELIDRQNYENMNFERDSGYYAVDRLLKDDLRLLLVDCTECYASIKLAEERFGDPVTPIGFPCFNGIGSTIVPVSEAAITAKTEHPAECWAFIKLLLSRNIQGRYSSSFPVRLDCLDALEQEAVTKPVEYWLTKLRWGTTTQYGLNGMRFGYNTDPLTQEQADKMRGLINSLASVQRGYSDLLAIIEDEAAVLFSGHTPVEDVAEAIQTRALAYMSRSS